MGRSPDSRARRPSAASVVVSVPLMLATLLPLVTLATTRTASAQGQDASVTFDYGRSEMLAGRYATACPALEASFRLDPRPGTLFTLADCERAWGRTASALARFTEYLALYERMTPEQQGKQKERATIAATERAKLERAAPLLTVRLPVEVPAGARVWRDETELGAQTFGVGVPVDPGEHRVRVALADGRSREQSVTVGNGEQRTVVVELPPGSAVAVAVPVPVAPPAPASPAAALAPPPTRAPTAARAPAPQSHAAWTLATAGVGAASLAVAAVTGGVALSERSTASGACNAAGTCSTQRGVDAGNEARVLADVETGALFVGGVALAAALVLWWTEPRGAPAPSAAGSWGPGGWSATW